MLSAEHQTMLADGLREHSANIAGMTAAQVVVFIHDAPLVAVGSRHVRTSVAELLGLLSPEAIQQIDTTTRAALVDAVTHQDRNWLDGWGDVLQAFGAIDAPTRQQMRDLLDRTEDVTGVGSPPICQWFTHKAVAARGGAMAPGFPNVVTEAEVQAAMTEAGL